MVKTYARFILSDRNGTVYECRKLDVTCRIEIANNAVTRFYDNGPIPRQECVDAVNALIRERYAEFVPWAEQHGIDPTEYPMALVI